MIASLPQTLAGAIDAELAPHAAKDLRAAAQALSEAYRNKSGIPRTLSPIERAAYLAVRFPSTFAVAAAVWLEFSRSVPNRAITSVLDIGAGPGTASLATQDQLPAGTRYTLIERDSGWRQTAERLARASKLDVQFQPGTFGTKTATHDVVVACYALGELPASEQPAAIDSLWQATASALIVIEPGTPKGFELVRSVREHTLERDAHAAAPCTHNLTCPMSANDWCHQPVRVARAAAHRAAKDAPLAYEDEKFSFVILTRKPPVHTASARIVRKPIRKPGHVHLDLCENGALQRTSIGKSAGPAYRAARDADWGQTWPPAED